MARTACWPARAARRVARSAASAAGNASGGGGSTAPSKIAFLHALRASACYRKRYTARALVLKSRWQIGQMLVST